MCLLHTLLTYNDTDTPSNCKMLGMGLLYKVGIDRSAVLVEAVQF